MRHITTNPYHPQANDVIVRRNGTVLRTLFEDDFSIWDSMLPMAIFTYNSNYNMSIKDSPFYLMHLVDPVFTYEIITKDGRWYNIDEFKEELATKANRISARYQKYLEEAHGRLEKNQNTPS